MFCPKNRPTLWPSHLTNYWKLLRKKIKGFKYYACGEYGSNRQRPHYHAILFIKDRKISPLAAFKAIEREWRHGETFVGTVTNESCAYVLKYLSKKGSVPQYAGDTRTKEFQRVSKGLGINYLTPQMRAWHHADLLERVYMPLGDGNKAPLPRYYKDKLYEQHHKNAIIDHMADKMPRRDEQTLRELRHINRIKMNT